MPRLSRPVALLTASLFAAGLPAAAEMRETACVPTAVKIDLQKMEILCADSFVLSDRSQDRFREVSSFAFPLVTQNFQPQLGSQFKLLDYYLDLAETALVNGRLLHVWFETDFSRSRSYGCDPLSCREIVALAVTHAPAVAPPEPSAAPAGGEQ